MCLSRSTSPIESAHHHWPVKAGLSTREWSATSDPRLGENRQSARLHHTSSHNSQKGNELHPKVPVAMLACPHSEVYIICIIRHSQRRRWCGMATNGLRQLSASTAPADQKNKAPPGDPGGAPPFSKLSSSRPVSLPRSSIPATRSSGCLAPLALGRRRAQLCNTQSCFSGERRCLPCRNGTPQLERGILLPGSRKRPGRRRLLEFLLGGQRRGVSG
jgi:hypothetical protein